MVAALGVQVDRREEARLRRVGVDPAEGAELLGGAVLPDLVLVGGRARVGRACLVGHLSVPSQVVRWRVQHPPCTTTHTFPYYCIPGQIWSLAHLFPVDEGKGWEGAGYHRRTHGRHPSHTLTLTSPVIVKVIAIVIVTVTVMLLMMMKVRVTIRNIVVSVVFVLLFVVHLLSPVPSACRKS